jgi:hypothetical protein
MEGELEAGSTTLIQQPDIMVSPARIGPVDSDPFPVG